MRHRPAIVSPPESRAFLDANLEELSTANFGASALWRFIGRSAERSWEEARARPRVLAELTVWHLLVATFGGPLWAGSSWLLTTTHLGLLPPHRDRLGWPNRLTLFRANLPALPVSRTPWIAGVALATDFADGYLARRGDETAFGAYADSLADAAFWSWFTLRYETDRRLRYLGLSYWLLPPSTLALAYFINGGSVTPPRPVVVRNVSVGLQGLIAARALWRKRKTPRDSNQIRSLRP